MSEVDYAKSPCVACGGNISFPPEAAGMDVQCPHCGSLTTLAITAVQIPAPDSVQATPFGGAPDPAVTVAPDSEDEEVEVKPKLAGASRGSGAKPPPAPRAGVAAARDLYRPPNPPRSRLKNFKPPPPPPTRRRAPGQFSGKVPGRLARSTAGVDRMPGGGVKGLKSLWSDDEPDAYSDILPTGQIRCQSCGARIPKDSKVCRSCGASISKFLKWFRRLGIASIVVLSAVAVVNWLAARTGTQAVEVPPEKQGVALLHAFLQKEKFGDLIYIRGAVTNNSPVEFFYVKVEFDLLDREGQIIGKATDRQNVIGANKIWNFKALILDPDAVGFTNGVANAVR